MHFIHELLEELVNLLKPLRLSGKLLLDIRGLEDVFKIHPLFLTNYPLFYNLIESEQVLFPVLCLNSQWLHIPASKNHINCC
jgi:hypothetical protein